MARALLSLSCALVVLLGCGAAQSPGAALLESANDFNTATRFGRMDLALTHASKVSRASLLDRRRAWGNEIRVLDVSVTAVTFSDEENADVMVQIAWTRMSESTLRSTSIRQAWTNPKAGGGWQVQREQRVSGDAGLFGDATPATREEPPAQDVHFESKSLGTTP